MPRGGVEQARLAAEIAELERLLAKNSLHPKRQFARLRGGLPPGVFREELKEMEGYLGRLDFKRARKLLATLSGQVAAPASEEREAL